MLLHLLKKDFLLVRKSALLMLLVLIGLPLFMVWQSFGNLPDEDIIMFASIFAPIFASTVLMNYLFANESKYSLAAGLLVVASYPRSSLVLSKYAFCLVVYVVNALIVGLESFLLYGLGGVSMGLLALVFFIITVMFGLYIPAVYKFGYQKTGTVFSVVIILSPMLLSRLMKSNAADFLSALSDIPAVTWTVLLFVAGAVIFVLSAAASLRIYNRQDLA